LINVSSSSLSNHIKHRPSHSRKSWSFLNLFFFLLRSIPLYFLEIFGFYKPEVFIQVQLVRWLDKYILGREISLIGEWLYSLISIFNKLILSVSNEIETFLILLEFDFLAYLLHKIPTYESIEVPDENQDGRSILYQVL